MNDREALRDEIAGWTVGSGYYAVKIDTDSAGEIADAILASDWLAEYVRAKEKEAWEAGHASHELPPDEWVNPHADALASTAEPEPKPCGWCGSIEHPDSGVVSDCPTSPLHSGAGL